MLTTGKLGKSVGAACLALACNGCYTLQQGYAQARLFLKQQPIDDVLRERSERADRLQKLALVPGILAFGRERVGLETGGSYQRYISLEGKSVTTIVQAASKRELRFKTWWFPIVGGQPYLGYFDIKDARRKRDELAKEGYDTSLGGVQAFSLLGYFPDPLYSSMLDGNDPPGLVELLLHECLHRTVYVPDHSAFNENLADFVAKKAAVLYLAEHPDVGDVRAYEGKYLRSLDAQRAFKPFLLQAKKRAEEFYEEAKKEAALSSDEAFLAAREKMFDSIAEGYKAHMAGREAGTSYAWAFRKGEINNAVLLGYSLYEAKQEPFEIAYVAAGSDVRTFVRNMKSCLEGSKPKNEDDLWRRVEECKG